MSYPCTYKWAAPQMADPPTGPAFREAITQFEASMLKMNGGADGLDDFPVTHHFAPSVYGREMLLPAGGSIVGKIHRHAHLNIVVRGRAVVATEFGRQEVKGGDIFVSKPGTKRAVHAIEDTVWVTIHPNHDDTQDLDAIERYVIAAPTFAELSAEDRKLLEVSQ